MKLCIAILLVIVMEAVCYSYLCGEECEQLKAENAKLKQVVLDAEVKNNNLKWDLMQSRAGVPQDEN